MALDLDAEIRRTQDRLAKLEMVKAVVADPEMATLLRKSLVDEQIAPLPDNGDSGADQHDDADEPGDASAPDYSSKSQIGDIRAFLAEWGKPFTLMSLAEQLRARGLSITNVRLNGILQRMKKDYGEIEIFERGSRIGPKPNKYIATDKLRARLFHSSAVRQ